MQVLLNNNTTKPQTIILQKRVQSLAIMDNHFLDVSSTFVALLMTALTCQYEILKYLNTSKIYKHIKYNVYLYTYPEL